MDTLLSLYIACTIFGVGVTIIDMLGILGDLFHGGDHGTGGGDHGGHGGALSDHGGVHGDSGSIHGDHGGVQGDFSTAYGDHGGVQGDFATGHGDHGGTHSDQDTGPGDHVVAHQDGQHAGEHGEKGSLVSHEEYRERHVLVNILSMTRSLVHFSLGFGPVGWFALATGRGLTSSLAWSLPVGVVALIGGRLLRRIQRSELDSQVTAEDLIMGRGEVLVSIGQGQIGKVRILMEDTYADRYARAKDPNQSLSVGTPIRVVDVSDEYVYVEEEQP